ncbi:hypothetical protein [Bacillus cereus group sp. TH152-1LC]|uniref:hypothetical protein n=1 Tax=Bacillus cereus group sp. TH152-1LC TaxID=3018060 RepID=UPI0022E0B038|nr:hypothetical protein [Bacillus cereus group sp. TH152-1LC]MDA1675256.1 hypothetical protein [Bacillus cereus group sp. TH152-1LC]
MFKTYKELKESYLKKFEVIVNKLNKNSVYTEHEVKIGPKSVSYKTNDYGTPTFSSKLEETFENHAVITFEYTEKIKKDEMYEKSKEYYKGQKHFEEFFDLMKTFWFEYIQVKKLDGMIFISTNEYFDENLVEYFKKKFTVKSNNPYLTEIIKKKTNQEVFYMLSSNTLQGKVEQFMEVKGELSQLITVEPLLKAYDSEFFKLFYESIPVNYAGKQITMAFVNDSDFDTLELTKLNDTENENETEKVTLPSKSKELHNYFVNIKDESKLLNLITNPMSNFKEVFSLLGLSVKEPNKYQTATTVEAYKKRMKKIEHLFNSLQEITDWEFVESEMGIILNEIHSGNADPIIDSINMSNKNRLVVHQFNTQQKTYFFALKRKFSIVNDFYTHDNEDDFELFVSDTEESADLQQFVYSVAVQK